MPPTALIAEDEPLLAAALKAELALAWPELQIVATVGDGHSAVAQALALQPDVLFFDIQMPGMSGLDAALTLVDEWPQAVANGSAPGSGNLNPTAKPFPALVFVTAYDQYAVQAFEAQAVDYLLKPINQNRLLKTTNKLASGLVNITPIASEFDIILSKLRTISSTKTSNSEPYLSIIQASVGNAIHLVKVADVLCFEAADKYVRVLAKTDATPREFLIRTPLKDLLPQLDPAIFWQVHRGTMVRSASIEVVSKDEAGKLWLTLSGVTEKFAVSRLYAHLFKAM